jgi:hypothetical protein
MTTVTSNAEEEIGVALNDGAIGLTPQVPFLQAAEGAANRGPV